MAISKIGSSDKTLLYGVAFLLIYLYSFNSMRWWGKEEVEEALINKNKSDNAREFLY
jgi:hypothetical protein